MLPPFLADIELPGYLHPFGDASLVNHLVVLPAAVGFFLLFKKKTRGAGVLLFLLTAVLWPLLANQEAVAKRLEENRFEDGIALVIVLYFLPYIIAIVSRKRYWGKIFLVNLFFGWAFPFGWSVWVITFFWAILGDKSSDYS